LFSQDFIARVQLFKGYAKNITSLLCIDPLCALCESLANFAVKKLLTAKIAKKCRKVRKGLQAL
jgi:hypothetical protein